MWGSPDKKQRDRSYQSRSPSPRRRDPSDRLLLQQLEVGKSESLLQQDGDGGPKDEEAVLQLGVLPVAEMNRNEPDQRCQEQRHQPEKRPGERGTASSASSAQNRTANVCQAACLVCLGFGSRVQQGKFSAAAWAAWSLPREEGTRRKCVAENQTDSEAKMLLSLLRGTTTCLEESCCPAKWGRLLSASPLEG